MSTMNRPDTTPSSTTEQTGDVIRARRDLLAALVGLLGGAVGTAPVWAQSSAIREANAPPMPAPGTALDVPPMPLLGGGQFEPAQAHGQVLVLYWWASWCPFCAETTPHVEALWRAQKARGLQLLALSIDTQVQPARDYLARRGYTLPAAWVTPAVQRALPKPRGLPVTLVRGRDGRVLQAEAGQLFPEDVQGLARHL
jgi:thiol-disulfide isomerase/thioredoxin